MEMSEIHDNIAQAADEAQRLLNIEFAKWGGHPPAGSALDQAGLRDGREIVVDFLLHGEAGLALEHLVYMIHETGIALSDESRNQIRKAASAMQLKVKL
jgi:hypothetical protein